MPKTTKVHVGVVMAVCRSKEVFKDYRKVTPILYIFCQIVNLKSNMTSIYTANN